MEGLSQRLAGVKAYLQQQVEHLRAKQVRAQNPLLLGLTVMAIRSICKCA